MFKFISLSVSIFFMLNIAVIAQGRFAQYRKIEAYEIRPGILMMPRYTAGNEVCEIGLEKLLYSPGVIRVNAELDRDEIDDILNELVPIAERGAASKGLFGNGVTMGGGVQATRQDFENVSIQIYGPASSFKSKNAVSGGEVVAAVKWKNRTCLQVNSSLPPASGANSKEKPLYR